MNFDNWEYRKDALPKDTKQRNEYLQQLKEKFLAEAEASPAVQDWLQQFAADTWKNFLNNYVDYKVSIINYSDQYIKKAEQLPELKHRKHTQMALAMLLQKKLFDLQCQWRADQLPLPGVRVTYDFWYWAKNIFNCPFLTPVTDAELNVLQRYIQTDDFDPEEIRPTSYQWQIWDEIQQYRKEQTDNDVVAWYDYYDIYMGTSMLLLLPDVRGPKEELYCDAVAQKEAAEKQETDNNTPPHVYVPPKPWLWYSVHRFYELAAVYDDQYFKLLIKAQSDEQALGDALDHTDGSVDNYLYLLRNIPNPPPVRQGVSWRQAIQFCYIDYLKNYIAQDLSAVCEEYQMYRSMNLFYGIDDRDDEEKRLEDFSISTYQIKTILEGRALLGEPEDLDF